MTPPPTSAVRDLRWLSIGSLALAVLVILYALASGQRGVAMVFSVIPLVGSIIAVIMDGRGRTIAIVAVVLSLVPILLLIAGGPLPVS